MTWQGSSVGVIVAMTRQVGWGVPATIANVSLEPVKEHAGICTYKSLQSVEAGTPGIVEIVNVTEAWSPVWVPIDPNCTKYVGPGSSSSS
jgi:hypothetical protein